MLCHAGSLHATTTFLEAVSYSDALTGKMAQPSTVAAHVPVTLEVLKQSYFNKIGARSIVPTSTLHSVTPKHLLMSTVSDQVCSVGRLYAYCQP
jgi:hypothetical protein